MANPSERLFDYPSQPHSHRHGPRGYQNYEDYKDWLRDEFTFTCAYCLVRERWQRGGHRHFSVEHLVTRRVAPARATDYSNLIYACVDCNSLRQDRVVLSPFTEAYASHLYVTNDGAIHDITPEGLAHIKVLQLDSHELTEYRKHIIHNVRLVEDQPEADAHELLRHWLGFPHDLPDLRAKRPPGGNTNPEAADNCYFQQRQRGELPGHY